MEKVAGVDWARDEHEVLVARADGLELLSEAFAHTEQGIAQLCGALRRLGVTRVAIERPEGVLVERLLETGIAVLAIHPNQVKAARARFRAAGGKSDRFDAFVLCELARTDAHRFRALVPDSDQTKALRALTRGREVLVGQRVALANQLRAELERFWPGAAEIFSEVDSPICLAFLERYPAPSDAQRLGEKRLASFLARHSYSGRRSAAELLRRLRAAPAGRAREAETEARRGLVLALVAALRPLVEQISRLTSEIGHALRAHPDGELFLSLFRDPKSVITAARLCAEMGDCRARYPTPEALAADAGMSAVAVESGRSHHAVFRRGCDKRLRDAFVCLADSSRHWHPWARRHYTNARARGHDHPRATRTVGRAWSRVLWRMWQDRTPYHPDRHNSLQRQLSPNG